MLLTNSEISTFRRCKRKWALGYMLGWQANEQPIYFTEGTLWHDAMEVFYKTGARNAALGVFMDARVVDPDSPARFDMLIALLWAYVDWLETEGRDQDLEPVNVEGVISADIGEDVTLRGKTDMVMYDSSLHHRVLLDHKLVRSFSGITDTLPLNQQTRTYGLIMYWNPELEPVHRALYSITRKANPDDARTKPPYFLREDIYLANDVFESHRDEILYTAEEMRRFVEREEDSVYPPTVEQSCNWCQFKDVCALMNDGEADWEWVLECNFTKGDPNARYA